MEEARPLFEAMGRAIHHIGGHGMGSAMKMVNNLILAQAMVAFSEGIVLGESLGIAQEMLFAVLHGSPVIAPFLAFKEQKLRSGQFDAEFPLQWMHKDLELAAETAYEAGVALVAGNLTKELYAMAMQRGLGEQDFSAVYALLNGKR